MLYTESDLEKSMDKIETIHFHQVLYQSVHEVFIQCLQIPITCFVPRTDLHVTWLYFCNTDTVLCQVTDQACWELGTFWVHKII